MGISIRNSGLGVVYGAIVGGLAVASISAQAGLAHLVPRAVARVDGIRIGYRIVLADHAPESIVITPDAGVEAVLSVLMELAERLDTVRLRRLRELVAGQPAAVGQAIAKDVRRAEGEAARSGGSRASPWVWGESNIAVPLEASLLALKREGGAAMLQDQCYMELCVIGTRIWGGEHASELPGSGYGPTLSVEEWALGGARMLVSSRVQSGGTSVFDDVVRMVAARGDADVADRLIGMLVRWQLPRPPRVYSYGRLPQDRRWVVRGCADDWRMIVACAAKIVDVARAMQDSRSVVPGIGGTVERAVVVHSACDHMLDIVKRDAEGAVRREDFVSVESLLLGGPRIVHDSDAARRWAGVVRCLVFAQTVGAGGVQLWVAYQ